MLAEIFGLEWPWQRPSPWQHRWDGLSPADRRARGLKPLAEACTHERPAVASVFERDRKLLEYRDRSGIRPGVTVHVVAANEAIDLMANGLPVRVERDIAAKVWVSPESARSDRLYERQR
jgi:hypothetical protein